LTATHVARNFSDVVNHVLYRHEAVVVERGGVAVCEIRPTYESPQFTGADLAELLRTLPAPPEGYLDAVEAGVRDQPLAEKSRWPR
jgi:hypothetical protein